MFKASKKKITGLVMSIFIICIGLFSAISFISLGYSAQVSGFNISGISASYDKGSWSGTSNSISGYVDPTSSGGGCNPTYSSQSATLTFTINASEAGKTLGFHYAFTVASGGSCQFNGSTPSPLSNDYSTTITGATTITFKLTSGSSDGARTSLSITGITLVSNTNVTSHFKGTDHGKIKVYFDGTLLTTLNSASDTVQYTNPSNKYYKLEAVPDSGYTLFNWYYGTTQLSSDSPYQFYGTDESNVYTGKFILSSLALFCVDSSSTTYYELDKAITAASSLIYVKKSGLLDVNSSGGNSYTIPSNKTLLIPMDADNTKFTTKPTVIYNKYETPTFYKSLEIKAGINITVNGVISLPGNMSAKAQTNGQNGTTTGACGLLQTHSGSTLTFNSGAFLYCWGFISGDGLIDLKSGATAYEPMQIKDWRGGTSTTNTTSAFPFNQYYLQNIECHLRINSGATYNVYSTVNASSSAKTIGPFTFISASSGLFLVSSGYIEKYLNSSHILILDVYGTISLSSFQISISTGIFGSITAKTSDYAMPITNNLHVHLHNHTQAGASVASSLSVSADLTLLPGTEITVDQGCTFNIQNGHNLFLVREAEWANSGFCGSATQDIFPAEYTVMDGKTTKRAVTGLPDAKLIINGTLNINGIFHVSTTSGTSTPEGGSVVCTEGTGEINFKGTTGSSKYPTFVHVTDKETTTMSTRKAFLKNGDGSYVDTNGITTGRKYVYYDDTWIDEDAVPQQITVKYYNAAGTSTILSDGAGLSGTAFTLNDGTGVSNLFTGCSLKNWINMSSFEIYSLGQSIIPEDNISVKAFFGGWLYDRTASKLKFIDYLDGQDRFKKNLMVIPNYDANSSYTEGGKSFHPNDLCLFDSSGYLVETIKKQVGNALLDVAEWMFKYDSSIYTGGDNNYYHIQDGIVQKTEGWFTLDDDEYYIGPNGYAYKSGSFFIEASGGKEAGIYTFNNEAKLIPTPEVEDPYTIDNAGYVKDNGGNVVYGYGLFSLTNLDKTYLYYGLEDGTIFTNGTIFVDKTNGYMLNGVEITRGLYYFDSNGRMYDSSFVLVDSGVTK